MSDTGAGAPDTPVPRVSVVVATYNWAPVLRHAVSSVLDQTFDDFELLVIGDACTDESGRVVGDFADPRVHWHNLETNFGFQSGPNDEGVRRARGGIIAYLGHDDLWCPSHLDNLVRAFDAGASFAHTTALRVWPVDRPEAVPPERWRYTPGAAGIAPTTAAHTAALYAEAGPWRHPRDTGSLEPDRDLWRRMAAISPPVWVHAMDCVKLAAARRKDVYRTRPDHEQAYWLARIRDADDPEQLLADACGQPYELAPVLAGAEGLPRTGPGRVTLAWRSARRAGQRAMGREPSSAFDRLRDIRRFKGLP